MGGEGAPLLLFPEALVCVPAAALFWLIAKQDRPITFAPLLVGFAVSMVGLALRAYVQSQSEDPPGRWLVFDAIVELLLVLPLTSFVVIPVAAMLVRRRCLTLRAIGLCALIGWGALSLVGWLLHLGLTVPHYPLSDFLKSAVVPTLIYGLPIPLVTRWFLRRRLALAEEGH